MAGGPGGFHTAVVLLGAYPALPIAPVGSVKRVGRHLPLSIFVAPPVLATAVGGMLPGRYDVYS